MPFSVFSGGDKHIGLDRFGRVQDHRWRKPSNGSFKDRFYYFHDRDGNRLFRDNGLNNSFDELYHANGASAGYDGLNQLVEFRRGPLGDSGTDSVPDTVASASRWQYQVHSTGVQWIRQVAWILGQQ